MRAVRTAMGGKVYLSPSAATVLADGIKSEPSVAVQTDEPQLSAREATVLKLLVEGLRNKEIAERLQVSVKSVDTYRARMMAKLGCASKAELIRYALREGIASQP